MGNPFATQLMITELLNLHRGQGQEILWRLFNFNGVLSIRSLIISFWLFFRDGFSCPTEAEYCKMVLDKTGVV